MITPFDSTIDSTTTKLNVLGFSLVSDSDYSAKYIAEFGDLIISTEKNYPCAIGVEFTDENSNSYDLYRLMLISSPQLSKELDMKLRDIENKYDLSRGGDWTSPNYIAGLKLYFQHMVDFSVRFFEENKLWELNEMPELKLAYEVREREALDEFLLTGRNVLGAG